MVPHDDGAQPLPIACAGAVVRDAEGRLLLVRRAHPPAQDTWTLPGGRVERGETAQQAAAREVFEETGLTVEIGELLGTVGVFEFLVHDFAATVTGGELVAGDDASDARWCAPGDLAELQLSPGLVDALATMGIEV